MTSTSMPFTVFTKPWRDKELPELADFVRSLGFAGIELPVRPGYQVPPEDVARLPRAADILGDHGVRLASVAGPTDEATIAACGEAGVPVLRICVTIPGEKDYLAAIADLQREWDLLVPLLEKHGVTLGIQNHCGRSIANSMQLRHALGKYEPSHVAAVWDAAHNALEGEQVDIALDTVWSHLCMVNLKSGYWRRTGEPNTDIAEWRVWWTSGRDGRANWPWVIRELTARQYKGDICLTAEYSEHDRVDELIVEDIAYVQDLLAGT